MRYLLFVISAIAAIGLLTFDPVSAHAAFGDAGASWAGWAGAAGLGAAALGACVGTELGAALRLGGCGKATMPRNWVRVDAMDSSRTVLGQMTQVRWAALNAKDPMGRFGYIKSLAIKGNVVITAGATNDAVSAYALRGLFGDIDLMDLTGHKYFAALDGRDLVDDHYYRHGRLPSALPGAILANVGAGSISRQIDTEIALVSRAVGASHVEGLIPIAALQTASMEAFQFSLRSAIPGSPAGLTVTGFTKPDGVAGLEIWAEVVYIAGNPGSPDVPPVIDAPWVLRNYTLQGQDQKLDHETRKHSYAVIRYRNTDTFNSPGGTTGQNLAGVIASLTAEVGGQTFLSALSATDIFVRNGALKREGVTGFGDSAEALGLNDLVLPAEPATIVGDVMVLPFRPTEDAPSGPVIVHMGTQPCTDTRWLHRAVGCDRADRVDAIKAAMQCECPVRVFTNTPNGSVDGALPKFLTK